MIEARNENAPRVLIVDCCQNLQRKANEDNGDGHKGQLDINQAGFSFAHGSEIPDQLKKVRRSIARVKTILTQKADA